MEHSARAVCAMVLLTWFSGALASQDPGSVSPDGQREKAMFTIVVDPRIELMNIVLTFTELPFYGKFPAETAYPYYQDVIRHFGAFRSHDAVKWCASFPYFRDVSFPEQMMLYVSDPPEMKMRHEPPSRVPQELVEAVRKTVDLLNRFAADSRFMEFWNAHQGYYADLLAPLKRRLPYDDYLRTVEEFYGTGSRGFVCVISPILHGAGFGATLETGNIRVPHFVTGPDRLEDGKPRFSDAWLRLLIFHEYGHSFVNPLCEKHRDIIMSRASLLQKLNGSDVIKKHYDDWFVVVHEHIVRAAEHLLLRRAGRIEESEANLRRNLGQGFGLLPAFIDRLEHYARHRSAYPDLSSYFPELLKVLDDASAN